MNHLLHHLNPLWVLSIVITICAAALILRSAPKNTICWTQACEREASSLPAGRFDGIIELLEDEDEAAAKEKRLWDAIGGLEGLDAFEDHTRRIVAILQLCVDQKLVAPQYAQRVHELAKMQHRYTELARLEATMKDEGQGDRYVAAFAAVQYHWKVTYTMLSMCRVEGAPAFLLEHGALL